MDGQTDNNSITFHLYAKTTASSKASGSGDTGPRALFSRRVRTTDVLAVRQSTESSDGSKGQGLWHLCGGRSVTTIPIGPNEPALAIPMSSPRKEQQQQQHVMRKEQKRKEGGRERREGEARRKNNSSVQFTSAKVTGTGRGGKRKGRQR